MGNVFSIKSDVSRLMKESASKPEVLLAIYQGENPELKKLAKEYGHSGGLCEGICCLWAKYDRTVDQESFINGFQTSLLEEIVTAHVLITRVKAANRAFLSELITDHDELRRQEKVLLGQSASAERDQNLREIHQASAQMVESSKDAEVRADEAVASIHGLRQYADEKGRNENLTGNLDNFLEYCITTNNSLVICMHKGRSEPGHALCFSADGRRRVLFLDPNSCLFAFTSKAALVDFFRRYWAEFYASDYDGYEYRMRALGVQMFS